MRFLPIVCVLLLLPSLVLSDEVAQETSIPPTTQFNVVVGQNAPAAPPLSPSSDKKQEEIEPHDEQALEMLYPDPVFIEEGLKRYRAFEKSKAEAFRPPKQNIRTVIVNQAPGSVPPPIYMFAGHSTTLVLTDGNGTPWPIALYKVGNEKAYQITDSQESPHILSIQPKNLYVPTNLTLLMKGRPMPIVFNLESMSNVTDSVVTAVLPGRSPSDTGGNNDIMSGGDAIPSITKVTAQLAPFLDNTPPTDAIVVPVIGDTSSFVWFWQGSFILTTNGRLTNPVPISTGAKLSSPDGEWHTYKLPSSVPPVFSILRSDGRTELITVAVDEVVR